MRTHSWPRATALLSVLLTLALVLIGLIGFATPATAAFIPQDTISLKVLSDGTHAGPGTETFVNTKNGYFPGDDTAHDGVVASGDFVIYGLDLNILAGDERTICLTFADAGTGDALLSGSFSKIAFSSPAVKTVRDPACSGVAFKIKRGAVAQPRVSVSVAAKDTGGKAVEDNKIQVTLTNGSYSVTSISEPVTVVSIPMADLTVDTVPTEGGYNRNYTQKSTQGGEFTIAPLRLQPHGYSSAGISVIGQWIADIDVSSFPAGTTWTLGSQSLTPVGGVLKAVKATGTQTLKYVLPESALPTKDTPPVEYRIGLKVDPDSFKEGDFKNIPDPGNAEGADYPTSSYTYEGQSVGALNGAQLPNNNYSKAVWFYYEEPKVKWNYFVGAPQDLSTPLFTSENKQWQSEQYWKEFANVHPQGDDAEDRSGITSGNALAHRLTIRPKLIDANTSASSIVVTDAINTKTGDTYAAEKYDSTRPVVVTVDGVVVDGSKHTVEWLVDGEWVETDIAPEGATQSRVSFDQSVFTTGDAGNASVDVYWPARALTYDAVADAGKFIVSQGAFSENAGADYDGPKAVEEALIFPKTPSLVSAITNVDEDSTTPLEKGTDGRYTTQWTITNQVQGAASIEGYSATTTLTLDPLYDPQTFTLPEDSSWEVDKIEGQRVTLRTKAGALLGRNQAGGGWTFGSAHFSVKTIANPYDATGTVSGSISSAMTLSYPAVGNEVQAGTTSVSDSSASARMDSDRDFSAVIVADQRKVEINDPLAWTAYVSMGRLQDGTKWKQEIKLPTPTDSAYVNELNAMNQYNPPIVIDPTTGLDTSGRYTGIGRSKYQGSYTLSEVTVTNAPPGSKIVFSATPNGAGVEKTVGPDGKVDLSGVPQDVQFMRIEATGNTSASQTAGAQIHFTITPTGNTTGDDYVAWLSPTEDPVTNKKIQAWPDYSQVVSSVISGVVWNDQNKDTRIDNGDHPEKRYEGVHVVLQKKNDGGTWENIPGMETTTNTQGEYSFTNLHSGDYRVVLPQVERKEGSTEVRAINGSSSGKDGDLPASMQNRFDVMKQTEQTRSGRKIFTASSSHIDVPLGVDVKSNGHNFGYYVPNADLGLDKTPAAVTDNGNETVGLTWNIDVKNTGDTVLRDVKLFDRTSAEVFNVKATTGYREVGEILGATGMDPTVSGAGVWTNEGYSLVKPDGQVIKVDGITGTVKGAIGLAPADQNGGSAVWTDQGYWLVKSDGTATKVNGITGTIAGAIGIRPTGRTEYFDAAGSAVWTDQGYWLVNPDGTTTKVNEVTGTVSGAVGDYPLSYGTFVWSSDGNWAVYGNGSALESEEGWGKINGTILGATGVQPPETSMGAGVWTDQGYNLYDPNLTNDPRSLENSALKGSIIGAISDMPSSTASGVWTNDKYWILSPFGRDVNTQEVPGITGTVLGATGGAPGDYKSGVWTTDGYWVVNPSGTSAEKITGITGSVTQAVGYRVENANAEDLINWIDTSAVQTTDGYWFVDAGNVATRVGGVTGVPLGIIGGYTAVGGVGLWTSDGFFTAKPGEDAKLVLPVPSQSFDSQTLTPVSTSQETGTDRRVWNKREFVLPMAVRPGQTVRVTVTGTVAKQSKELWVGNQAWTTSVDTPREGIRAHSQVEVTGANMGPGVPDIPVLENNAANLKPEGIFKNATSGVNSAVGVELEGRKVDDLSDQTPALIPATTVPLGGVSGIVWYDDNGNDVRDASDRRVAGMKVLVTSLNGDPLGEAVSGTDGTWKVTGIPAGTKVLVRYSSTGWQGEDKDGQPSSWAPVRTGVVDPHSDVDSDADAVGIVTQVRGAEATVGVQSGYADLGLRTVNAQIALVKGAVKDTADRVEADTVRAEDELDDQLATPTPQDVVPADVTQLDAPGRIDDRDGDPRTQVYTFSYENTGSERLTDIQVSDTTLEGNPAVLSKTVVIQRAADQSVIQAKLDDEGTLVDAQDTVVVLEKGDKVLGRYAIAFTASAPTHKDTLTVTAGVTTDGTSIVGQVSDSDSFTATYEVVQPRSLVLEKTDGETVLPLKSVVLTVQKTTLGELPADDLGQGVVAGELGTFLTDSTGQISLPVKSGVYRLVEKTPAAGYVKPAGVWYVQVSYTPDGDPRVVVMATPGQPTATVTQQPGDGTWGQVRITNDKIPGVAIPMTGGRAADWIYAGALLLALIAGLGAAVKKHRNTQAHTPRH